MLNLYSCKQERNMKKTLAVLILGTSIFSSSLVYAQSNDYYKCINASNKQDDGYAKCYLEEAKRDVARIDDMYQKLSSDSKFIKWNDGNGMFKGNFKNMLDTWINYRNRYCSLYAEIYSAYDGSSYSFHQADCIMKMSRRHADDMEDLWKTSFSKIEG